jgi:hypothetical protein
MNQLRELLHNFYLHIILLHNLQTQQHLIDYNIQLFLNSYKGIKEKKEKPPKTNKKKNNSTNNETAPPENDIISELVTLANGTDYGTSTPTNVTTDAPGAPIKEKRKYNRKPKVQNVNEALEATTADNVVDVAITVAEKPVKEKKPRKPKASKEPVVVNTDPQEVSENNVVSDDQQPIIEKPVKEKKPRKSNKKADTVTVEQPLEGTEINL